MPVQWPISLIGLRVALMMMLDYVSADGCLSRHRVCVECTLLTERGAMEHLTHLVAVQAAEVKGQSAVNVEGAQGVEHGIR